MSERAMDQDDEKIGDVNDEDVMGIEEDDELDDDDDDDDE